MPARSPSLASNDLLERRAPHRDGDLAHRVAEERRGVTLIVWRKRNPISVNRERQSLAARRRHVAGKPLPRHDHPAVEWIEQRECPRLREDLTRGGRVRLDIPQRVIATENRRRTKEDGSVGTRRQGSQG